MKMHTEMKRTVILLTIFLCLSQFAVAAVPRILIDGEFGDWDGKTSLWSSAATSSDGNVTLQQLKAFNDDDFLFIYFKAAEIFCLQEDHPLTLYIDTDNNNTTGLSVDGIGAEIEFNFNERSGVLHLSTDTDIAFSDLFMITAPTVWANEYEISVDRHAQENTLFTSSTIKILLKDETVTSGTPSQTDAVTYTFGTYDLEPLPSYSIQKQSDDYLRVLSHNVEFDGFFETENLDKYERLYSAINPNIIGFIEIYNHSDAQVCARLEEILPSPEGRAWQAAHINDNFVASRYTILNADDCGNYGNGAFLIDMRPDYNTNALIIVGHPKCCSSNDDYRSDEIDAIAAYIRDAKAGTGSLKLQKDTPIIILGDMNLVGNPHQWQTLLAGDIDDEITFGSDFTPDWDGTDFDDALPYDTHLPMAFTQGIGTYTGSFSKGRIDVTLYSGSVLDLKNSFVLYTKSLPGDSLTNYGLQSGDTESASDHFPLVSDYVVNADQGRTISDLHMNDANGYPLYYGEVVTVSGVVTVGDEFGTNGPAHIQDNTAGISVYGSDLVSQLNTGDSVTITSPLGFFQGLTELVYNASSSLITVHGSASVPEPTVVSIADILNQDWGGNEELESKLLKLENVEFTDEGSFGSSTANYTVSDGINSLAIRIVSNTNLAGTSIPTGPVSIVGVLDQYDTSTPYGSGYRLKPRSTADITEYTQSMTTLSDLRQNDASGMPIYLNSIETVKGIVTVANDFGTNGPAYIQDESAGIAIYGSNLVSQLTSGNEIQITSPVGVYSGLTQFTYDSENSVITVLGNTDIPDPMVVSISDILNQAWNGNESLEGMLLKLENITFSSDGNFSTSNYSYEVSDGINSLNVRISATTDIAGTPIPSGPVSIIGVLSQYDTSSPYNSGYRLMPRSLTDITTYTSPQTTISDLRENDATGKPVHLGDMITVSGTVTVSNELGSNGPAYIQDDAAGVCIYGSSLISQLNAGDMITITSPLGFYQGLTQFTYDADSSKIIKNGTQAIPDPALISINDILNQEWNGNEALEGLLIKLENVSFQDDGNFTVNTNFPVTDGSSVVNVRIEDNVDLAGTSIPTNTVSIIGVIGQYDSSSPYSSGYQVIPRSLSDIIENNFHVASPVANLSIFKNSPAFELADLDTVFSEAPEGQSIQFSVSSNMATVGVALDGDHVVTVTVAQDWTGTATITLTGSLEGTVVNDLVTINVYETGSTGPQDGGPYLADANTVLLMHFDNNTDNAASAGVDGIAHGTVSYGTSRDGLGQCIRIDNSSSANQSWIEVPFYEDLNFSDEFSIECWFKINSWGDSQTAYPKILSKRYNSTSDYELILNSNNQSLISYLNCIDEGDYSRSANPEIIDIVQTGAWYHVAAYFDFSQQFLYLILRDENYTELATSREYTFTQPVNSNGKLYIGFGNSSNTYFDGWIDELRISNTYRKYRDDIVAIIDESTLKDSVASLLKDKWKVYQWPFPAYFPHNSITGEAHKGNSCGITAMMRLIHYWEYPRFPVGYLDFMEGDYHWVEDLNNTEYRFDEMPYVFGSNPTQEEYDATATMVAQVGAAAKYFSIGSGGAPITNILNRYFLFNKNQKIVYREEYTKEEWIKIFKNELSHGRPILIGGIEERFENGNVAGHYYICDGYKENKFHTDISIGSTEYWVDIDEFPYGINQDILIFAEPYWNGRSLDLTYPLGNEYLQKNSQINITWNAENISTVMLEYSANAGKNWEPIADHIAASAGSYSWTLPDTVSNQFKIRISNDDDQNIYMRSETFNVFNEQQITFQYPMANSYFQAGSIQPLFWESEGIPVFRLEYSIDRATWITLIDSVVASNGLIYCMIPDINSNDVSLRAVDLNNNSNTFSSEIFTVNQEALIGGTYKIKDNDILLMHFDQNLDNLANNEISANYSGSSIGYIDNFDMHLGKAFRIENVVGGNNNCIIIPHAAELNFDPDWSIETWINIASVGTEKTQYPSLISKNNVLNIYLSSISGGYGVGAEIKMANGTDIGFMQNTALTPGEWYHIAFKGNSESQKVSLTIHNANREVIYQNSTSFPHGSDGSIYQTDNDIYIGGVNGGSNIQFDGWIDELCISNGAAVSPGTSAEKLPNNYSLSCYPNPFNANCTIEYELPASSVVRIDILDLRGRVVKTALNNFQTAGNYKLYQNMTGIPSGLYIYRLSTPDMQISKPMVIVK